MRLQELLSRHVDDAAAPPSGPDVNLDLLEAVLAQGYRPVTAAPLPPGTLGPGAGVLLTLEREGRRQVVPVGLGGESRRFLLARAADVPVAGEVEGAAAPSAARRAPRGLGDELLDLFRKTEALPPEERAAALMDWIMERTEASRCALIPFEGGIAGPPLAFHLRGSRPGSLNPRHVPRRIVAQVAQTRQPLVGSDLGDSDASIPVAESAVRQRVKSYMAVPVVFRGELLAVCYVDRFDRPDRFSPEEQASFESFAYELAFPLLALRDEQRRREYRELRDALAVGASAQAPRLLSSPALEPVLERARSLAPHVEENLLLLGETGVGKEAVARMIHEASGRAARPFVAVNVSAVSGELFESELMGTVRGAFTGAVDRPGRVAQAEGGTLFLDEIGDLPLANQIKLLRFLQDKRVVPVGGKEERVADVRVVAATNRPLEALLRRGDWREDLFHRFAPPLRIPPLRERREEILPHARAWLDIKARQRGLPPADLTADAEEFLLGHPWPGNVRQLQMVVSNALLAIRKGAPIDAELLRSLLAEPAGPAPDAPGTWAEFRHKAQADEREWLRAALAQDEGKLEVTARRIGCPASTLRDLVKKHGL